MNTKKKEKSEVPISAMIDVVFLLLVYFIVTMKTTIDQAWVSVNLPGTSEPKPNPPHSVDIFVQSGEYIVQNRVVSSAQLEDFLKSIKASNGDHVSLNLKVSLYAKHSRLVNLLDLLSKNDLENFNLHSLKEEVSI